MPSVDQVTARERIRVFGGNSAIRFSALLLAIPILATYSQVFREAQFDFSVLGAIILALTAYEHSGNRDTRYNLAAWLPASFLLGALALIAVCPLSPHTIDQSLDFGFARSLWNWSTSHSAIDLFFRFIYASIMLAIGICLATSHKPWAITRTLIISTILAAPLYVAFPATGPHWVGDPTAPRNCIPSLHAGWTMILAMTCEPKWRWLFIPFAVLTAISTMTTGEHYLIDVLVAVPFSGLCVWLGQRHATHP